MAYAAPNGRVYEGTYDNPSGDKLRSRVFEYTGDGTLLRSWTIQGQNLDGPHGVQVGTFDGARPADPARQVAAAGRCASTASRASRRRSPGSRTAPSPTTPRGARTARSTSPTTRTPTLWRVPPGGAAGAVAAGPAARRRRVRRHRDRAVRRPLEVPRRGAERGGQLRRPARPRGGSSSVPIADGGKPGPVTHVLGEHAVRRAGRLRHRQVRHGLRRQPARQRDRGRSDPTARRRSASARRCSTARRARASSARG